MNTEPIDVIIPLIKQLKNGDTELLFCLRSIEKHLTYFRNVVIIGEYLPNWLNPKSVTLIHYKDGPNKQENIRGKIIKAFASAEVTDRALFTNDDIFLTKDQQAGAYPFYYCGDLNDSPERGAQYLIKDLKKWVAPTKLFDIHTPIVYDSYLFESSQQWFHPESIIKSAYCNFLWIDGEELKDLKINSYLSEARIKEEIEGRPCFSIGDYGLNNHMKSVLQELYPNKSRYEL